MRGASFCKFIGIYEQLMFPKGIRMFAFHPDRICEKFDKKSGLLRINKSDFFVSFKGERCERNRKKHGCDNKTMNISWGFSLRIEISGKACVYHNLLQVFNSYVLLRGGEGGARCWLFFVWYDAMVVAIAWGQNKQSAECNKIKKSKQSSKQPSNQTSNVACFFFGPMQWLEPLRAAKRNK